MNDTVVAELSSVSKTYAHNGRAITALVDATLKLRGGEFIAVSGPSGCGKSTMLLTLGGLLRPDTGHVRVDNQDLYTLSPGRRATYRGQKIGFVFQQFHLVPYLSVLDNVLSARLGITEQTDVDVRSKADAIVRRLGLSDRRKHRPAQLSTGERQRTALARAMLNEPRLLLADEPTGNLDQKNAEVVLDFMAEFAESGGAVLLVTHDSEAARRAESRLRMEQGRILEV